MYAIDDLLYLCMHMYVCINNETLYESPHLSERLV